MKDMIDITGVDLKDFVKAVYALSVPVGMGFLHATPRPLSDEDAQAIVNSERPDGRVVLHMDYVHGRQCKMVVFREDGRHYIRDDWYDHTPAQLEKLLEVVGVKVDF